MMIPFRSFLYSVPFFSLRNKNNISVRRYTPRRALMYVPGDDVKKINKIFGLQVDCITLDCEDGVAWNKKADARKTIREVLENKLPENPKYFDLGVRVNSVESEFHQEDVRTILTAKHPPNTILLPKVENKDHLTSFAAEAKNWFKGELNLIIYIESAKGYLNLRDILESGVKLSDNGQIFLRALVFGSDDLCASLGALRSEDSTEIIYARQKLVLMAKAFDLQAIDMVYIKYKDLDGLKAQCIQGMKMGYTGKQVIHPDQIQIVQETFLPTDAQVEWAEGLLRSFSKHQEVGKGAFTYHGSMIDMPAKRQAENIMKLAQFRTASLKNK